MVSQCKARVRNPLEEGNLGSSWASEQRGKEDVAPTPWRLAGVLSHVGKQRRKKEGLVVDGVANVLLELLVQHVVHFFGGEIARVALESQ